MKLRITNYEFILKFITNLWLSAQAKKRESAGGHSS